MGTFKQHGLLCTVWIALFCGGLAGIVLLCFARDSILERIGQSGATTGIAGGDTFLEIKGSYLRMLALFNVGTPISDNAIAEHAKDIARIETAGYRRSNPAEKTSDAAPSLPLGFPASDSLWISGKKSESKALLRRVVLDAGFQMDKKNLLTALEKK